MAAHDDSHTGAVAKLLTSVDGTSLYAEALGDPSKPAIVFIHGFSFSSTCFDDLFADTRWQEHVYLVRYDTRGHGQSGKPVTAEAYESRRMGEDFVTVLNAFGLKKVFLAGWSMGAIFAADVCAYSGPSVLHGIIYFDGVPYCSSEIFPRICTEDQLNMIPGMLTDDDVPLFSRTAIHFVETCVFQKDKMAYRLRSACIGDYALVPPIVRQLSLARPQDPTALFEAGKTVPLLMLHGTEDARLVGKNVEQELRPHFGDRLEVHHLEQVGHAPFIEEPDKTRDLVLRFVRRVMETTGEMKESESKSLAV